MKGLKTIYICEQCEYKSPKWMGKCPSCGEWNTFIEDVIDTSATTAPSAVKRSSVIGSGASGAVAYKELTLPEFIRTDTGLHELDRVLGGGLVFAAVFMITDYVTTPITRTGRMIFAVGCGIITVLIRFWGSYPEGVSFSVLIMNIVSPYIEKWTMKKPFGGNGK